MTAYSYETFQDVVAAAGDEISAAKRCFIAAVCSAATWAVGITTAIVIADIACAAALTLTASAWFSLVVAIFVMTIGFMITNVLAQLANDWVMSGKAAMQYKAARAWVTGKFKRDASSHIKGEMAEQRKAERVEAEPVETPIKPIVTKRRRNNAVVSEVH